MPKKSIRRLPYAGIFFSAMFVLGCGKDDPNQQLHKAEKVVEEFLDAWSRNEPPDTFAGSDRPIQGTDPDWKAGYRLMSFLSDETKRNEEKPDHIRCRFALFLKDKKGKQWDKNVVYDVQLGEKTIIRRESP
jgi:hypothetical protein